MSYPKHHVDYCLEPDEIELNLPQDLSFHKNKSTNLGSSVKKVSDRSTPQKLSNAGSFVRVMSNSFGGNKTIQLQKMLRNTIQSGREQGISFDGNNIIQTESRNDTIKAETRQINGGAVKNGSRTHLRAMNKNQTTDSSQSSKIYEGIIGILQQQNMNIKKQNKYLLAQYQKLHRQNYELKTKLKSFSLQALILQTQKLQQINETYEKQIQELKYILLEEMVGIHQKINLALSGEEVTTLFNQLSQTMRKSTTLINTERLTVLQQKFLSSQTLNEPNGLPESNHKKTLSGMVMSEFLSFYDSDNTKDDNIKEPGRTAETFGDDMLDTEENCWLGESPTETTFSGNL